MLGEFHKDHQAGGLRHEKFRPLHSPLPLLVIRYIVHSELPFLDRQSDPIDLRTRFLRAYDNLFRLHNHPIKNSQFTLCCSEFN